LVAIADVLATSVKLPRLFPLVTTIIVVAVVVGVSIVAYVYLFPAPPAPSTTDPEPKQDQQIAGTQTGCLNKDEVAEITVERKQRDLGDSEGRVLVLIKNRIGNKEKRRFYADNIRVNYHSVESHGCGVYAVRMFNYDYSKTLQPFGYREELWTYDYTGEGNAILLLTEKSEKYVSYYDQDFRVDPSERYLVLEKGYAGSSDGVYDIVFKDLKTMENVFVLPVSEVWENNPDTISGSSVGFDQGWSKDGRYFWANFFGGAPVFGYIRIDSQTWTYELFPAPPDVLGGDQLNLETGWLTVHPGNVWFGVAELFEEEKAKRRVQGIGTDLYLHNLLTGQRLFVAHTDEPIHYFKPKWLSDAELEYSLPSGERKVFTVPK